MTTTAQSIIQEAQELLQDPAGIRWPATELVAHLNDGQREITDKRPDLATKTAAHALVAGARQTMPADFASFVGIPRNTGGAALRMVGLSLLDAMEPNWYSKTGVTVLKHVCYDRTFDPREFYAYPPAALGASVDLVYAAYPADIAAPTGPAYTTVSGNIGLPDQAKNALLHWCLFRAYSKDAEFGGNAVLSGAHLQLFKASLGLGAPAA